MICKTFNRDIHIIEVDGSSNENGSLVLEVTGKGERGGSSIGQGGSTSVERNITFVLRTSRPTTWSLHATSLQGTITLLVVCKIEKRKEKKIISHILFASDVYHHSHQILSLIMTAYRERATLHMNNEEPLHVLYS